MKVLNFRLILLTFISLNVFSYQSNDSYLESFFNLFKTENKNYFICDHIDGDRTSTLIIDTKRKKLTWGENDDFENFREGEVSITVESFGGLINDDLKRFKTIWRFDKLKGTFEKARYSRETPTQNYEYAYSDKYNCRKTEPLLD